MGIGLKDIMDNDTDNLVQDKSKKTLKILIYVAIVIFILIIIVFGMLIMKSQDIAHNERIQLASKDITNLSTLVSSIGSDYRLDPGKVELVGVSLEDNPMLLNVNGRVEEYRYGYYYISAEEANAIMPTLNLKNENYIVNYTTGEVLNVVGVKYNGKTYYAQIDIVAISDGMLPPSDRLVYIKTADELDLIRSNPGGYFKLSADIDMNTYSKGVWEPIENFSGTFEGRGYTISNLKISNASKRYCGLIGQLSATGRLSEINLKNVDIAGGEFTGALVGESKGTIKNCSVEGGRVTSQYASIGGLVGAHETGLIESCHTDLEVSGREAVGGFIGTLYSGTLNQLYSKGHVVGIDSVGGFVGNVAPTNMVNVEEVFSHSAVSGNDNVGGLVGNVRIITTAQFNLTNSYSTGAILTADNIAGGLIGKIYASNNSGLNFNSVYTASDTPMQAKVRGGFVGEINAEPGININVNYCFWEKDSLIDIDVLNIGKSNKIINFESKTPSEMMVTATFGNWDLTLWDLKEGESRPYLRWEVFNENEIEE